MTAESEHQLKASWGETLAACGLSHRDLPDLATTLRVFPTAQGTLPPPEEGDRPAGEPTTLDLSAEFLLGGEIAQGGMGVVHEAVQTSLGRTVAVKRPKGDQHRSPEWRRAFAEEARITALLDHPHIVPVHALGHRGDQGYLLAMKRIEGRTWRAALRDEPPSAGPAALRAHLEVFRKVVDAVAFAHDRGFIHRDLKPDNVMVGAYGEVYVLDWGLATSVEHEAETLAPAGTPAYMAPEMAACGPVGPATDVYLLGGILHQLLYGRPPHQGATLLATLAAALDNDLLPLEELSAAASLVELASRCLATDPAERFASAVELRDALERVQSGEAQREKSQQLTEQAEARRSGDASYAGLFEVDGLLQAALQAWPDNPRAKDLQAEVAEALVREALRQSDLGLGESLLGRVPAERVAPLRGTIEQLRRESDPESVRRLDRAHQGVRVWSGTSAVCAGLFTLTSVGTLLLGAERLTVEVHTMMILLLAFGAPATLVELLRSLVARRLKPAARGVYLGVLALSATVAAIAAATAVVGYAVLAPHDLAYFFLLFLVVVPMSAGSLRQLLHPKVRALFPVEGEE